MRYVLNEIHGQQRQKVAEFKFMHEAFNYAQFVLGREKGFRYRKNYELVDLKSQHAVPIQVVNGLDKQNIH